MGKGNGRVASVHMCVDQMMMSVCNVSVIERGEWMSGDGMMVAPVRDAAVRVF